MQNQFELTDKVLGKGAFGEVLVGKNKSTGEEVAVKVINKVNTNLEALVREIQILKSCDHENIIRFYGYSEDSQNILIYSELAKGGELFTHIVKRKKYNEGDARAIVKQLLAALTYLHSNNVAHLDLKPENLLLKSIPDSYDDEGSNFTPLIKLADFGTSVVFNEKAKNDKILAGTPGYVAPEVLLKKEFTTQPDVYAVGVIVYVMLSGCMPFGGKDVHEILKQQVKGQWKFNSRFDKVSQSARDFITACMTIDHTKRPTALQLLRHQWLQEVDVGRDLADSQADLKKYLAKLRLKAGFTAMVAANRLMKVEELLADD